jgi:TonB family protein
MRIKRGVFASMIALALACQLAVAEPPNCDPNPAPVKVDVTPPDRESRVAHEGDVMVEVTIDLTGAVVDARIISSTDSWFDQSVLLAARAWLFTPTKQICRRQFPVHFQLRPER